DAVPALAPGGREELRRGHRLEREAALVIPEPWCRGLRLHEPRPGAAVGLVVLVDLCRGRAADPAAGLDRQPAQLIGVHPARRAAARAGLGERRAVAREAAAEARAY